MTRYDNVPFIGLSATPYSKGLGKYWDDLLVPITPRQLIDLGYLCPTDYYVGETISTKGIKKKALPTGGSDFDAESLGAAMIDSETFNGDVVENYRVHSADLTKRATAFSPSVAHSKALVEKFNAAGIPALHIDGYMPEEERKYIYSDHRSGKALVLSCSRLLGTGYDDPSVEILIDCFPTSKNSKISWIQRAGRIWRIAPGKERAIYLATQVTFIATVCSRRMSSLTLCIAETRSSMSEIRLRRKRKSQSCVTVRYAPRLSLGVSAPVAMSWL